MAYLVDSSVWIALFLHFDTQHGKAADIIEELSGIIYVPYCVIAEVATVLAYKHSKQLADNFIIYTRDNRDLKIVNSSVFDEMDFYTTITQRLSFTDAALIFLCGELDAQLVTFDKQLESVAKTLV